MRSLTRLAAAALITGLTLGAAGAAHNVAAAPAKGPYTNLAGKWGVDIVFLCNGAVKGKNSCHVPEVEATLGTITARPDGSATLVETDVAQAKDPGALALCGPAILANNARFTGQCVYAGVGTGYFAPSKHGNFIGFWIKGETYHFPKGVTVHNPPQNGKYPMDTGLPARPGVYNTAAAAKLFGIQSVPGGLTVRFVVTHIP